jgi:lipopolysaccharide export system permease protein
VRILWRYLALEYLKAFVGALFGVTAIYIVVDFVDRARIYSGPGWQAAAAVLYGYKTIAIGYQLAPAALLLAAGIALSGLRRRGEYTALRALAIGPSSVILPVAAMGVLLACGLILADEFVVGRASMRVDEIAAHRFKFYGDYRTFFGGNRWFHGKSRIYHLRRGDWDRGFEEVTLFQLSSDFRLAQRIDARRMESAGGTTWKLLDGTRRDLSGLSARVERFDELTLGLDEAPASFRVVRGRPEQMPLLEVNRQIAIRTEVGLPSDRYRLALHNKLAYPLGGLPGAMLACALALRPGRRGTLTTALAEGFLLIVAFWALLVVCKAAALAGGVSPAWAAWLPDLLFSAVAFGALKVLAR